MSITLYAERANSKSDLRTALGDDKPLAIDIREACALAGVGLTTGWKLIRERRLESVKVGRRRLVLRSSIEQLLQPSPSQGHQEKVR